jgi:hypothetical protein
MCAGLVVLGIALGVTACADDGDEVTDPIDVAEVGVTAIEQADVMVCQTERLTLQTAVEAYTALNGAPPATEAELVGDWLREESPRWDLDPSGAIVAAPDGGC